MKKQLTKKALTLLARAFALSLLFAASAGDESASAQTANALRVSVPFEFVVGEERLPAGEYTVRRIVTGSEKTLSIRRADGHAAATVHTNAAVTRSSSAKAELVFTRHGEQYFLALVSTPGAETARALPKSRIQRSLERELAEKSRRAGGDDAAAKAATAGETVTITGALR